jgi:hypothetical protein
MESLVPTWQIQARHDGRLAVLVDELCGITLPEDACLDGCGGTIVNIGNGNSLVLGERVDRHDG